ncbi:hypothetical protein GOODEAATRI_012967, partial [Goodea atripinnis]
PAVKLPRSPTRSASESYFDHCGTGSPLKLDPWNTNYGIPLDTAVCVFTAELPPSSQSDVNFCFLGKPEITSHEGPVDGQVRCVAEGYPAPQIKWYYCDQYVRCSQQKNATQEEHNVRTVTLVSPKFGKTGVESRVNVNRGRFNTLECVATAEGEQAFILFSISGK